MPIPFRSKKIWIPALCVLLLALYALAGFLWAPKLVRNALLENVQTSLGLKASVGEIHINPFLFKIEIKDFSLPDAAGEKLLGFDRLYVDFELSSLWHRAYVFQDIEIDGPFAHAIVLADGKLNLAALQPKTTAPAPPKSAPEPLPAIQIQAFSVSRGLASYEDRVRAPGFISKIDPISFDLKDFTTGVQGGRFTFTGSSKLDEKLQWQGHFSLQPLESDGDFVLTGLKARTLWEYLQHQVSFVVHSGSIDLNGKYRFAMRQGVDLQLDLAKVSLSDLSVRPREDDIDWIVVPNFSVNQTAVDLARRSVNVDSVIVTGVKLLTWLDPAGNLNLLSLARPATASPPATGVVAPAAANATPQSAAAGPAWQLNLREFSIQQARISIEDRSVRPAVKALLAPLNVSATAVSLDLAKPLAVRLDTGINDKGRLSVDGSLTPAPLVSDLNVMLSDLELKAVQPYIAKSTALTLLDGRLNVDGKVHFSQNTKPTLKFAGDVGVDRLHTVDNALKQDFIDWERLQLAGIDFQQTPDRLAVEKITARKLYARVLIEPDSTLNVKRILAGPKGLPATLDDSPHTTPAKSAAAKPASASMPIEIRKVIVEASSLNFADMSIKPNFAAGVNALHGSISGLSSKPGSRAKIDLHGQVDRFSPVEILGQVNIFGPVLFTDLQMNFRNMELTTFNPYSGKFAGYNISKGKLTTELNYKIDGRKLDAGHHIIVDQLEFGDKTASKDAVSLPIKLGVALLKDRHGVIDLNLPVSGSLDDPQFRLAPVIWKVLLNLLVKAVTAPFALIGSLFGGGPDLQFVDFPAGSASLDDAGRGKVKAIEKALAERPQLKIEIPLADVPDLDRPALVEAHFKASIREQQVLKAPRKQAGQDVPPFDSLSAAQQLDLLSDLFKKDLGTSPQFPEQPKSMAKSDLILAKTQFLRESLRQHAHVEDGEIKSLAQRRAESIQQALLEDKQIGAERVFLVANNKAKAQGEGVRLELSLQ